MHEFTQKRETINYRYGQISTPFHRANQTEAGTLAALIHTTKLWRFMACFCFCINLLLLLWLIVSINTPWHTVMVADMVGNGYVKDVAYLNPTVNPKNDIFRSKF